MTYKEYTNGENTVSLSDSWSRRSIKKAFDDDGLLWTLLNKSEFSVINEDGVAITKKELADDNDLIFTFDLQLHNWLSETVVEHIDFLLESVKTKKEAS